MDLTTTTTAPSTTTTAPSRTTTAPSTTTTAPGTTTTAPSTTTTAPSPTTTAPSITTTAPSITTTAPQGTTTAPQGTTTAPQGTTTAPPAGGGAPSVDSFTGAPKEDDGANHDPASLQIESGKAVVLSWQVSNAPDGIELTDPAQSAPQTFDSATSSTEVTPSAETQDYSLVAISGSQRSDPRTVHVSAHQPGQAYSPHAQVHAPSATTTAPSATTTAPSATTTAPSATTTAPSATTTAPSATTTAPSATTTAPSATTTAPSATTTAPSATTTTAPATTTTARAHGPLRVRLFDPFGRPLAGVACKIFVGSKELFAGNAGADGFVQTGDLELPDTCQVKWTTSSTMPASDDLLIYSLDAYVNLAGQSDEQAARMRLANLGYRFGDALTDDIKAFQRDRGLAETGSVADVKDKLAEVHDNFEPATKEPPSPFFMSSNHEP